MVRSGVNKCHTFSILAGYHLNGKKCIVVGRIRNWRRNKGETLAKIDSISDVFFKLMFYQKGQRCEGSSSYGITKLEYQKGNAELEYMALRLQRTNRSTFQWLLKLIANDISVLYLLKVFS